MKQEILPPSKSKPTLTAAEAELQAHAGAVRLLGRRMIGDAIEIGRRLHDASALCKREGIHWENWLHDSLGWSKSGAANFVNLYELSLATGSNFERVNLPVSGLMLLAQPATSAEAREAVLDRAATGKRPTVAQIKKMLAAAEQAAEAKLKQKIADLKAEHAEREQDIRAEYEDHVSPKELKEKIDKTLKPVEQKLEIVQEELSKKLATKQKLDVQNDFARDLVLLDAALRGFANALTVKPDEFLAADLDNENLAVRIHSWLTKYLDLIDKRGSQSRR